MTDSTVKYKWWYEGGQRNEEERRGTAICTEGEFHLQKPHCGVSNGQSHFLACQSLQSDVPKGKMEALWTIDLFFLSKK